MGSAQDDERRTTGCEVDCQRPSSRPSFLHFRQLDRRCDEEEGRRKDKFRHIATDYYHLDDRMTQVQRRMHLGLHTMIMVWEPLLVRS